MSDGDIETTLDRFLGGRVVARQPRDGFRSANDAVLLAASVPARAGQRVLELGCGVGVALLCLSARVPGLELAGVDINAGYLSIARQNFDDAGLTAQLVVGAVPVLPRPVSQHGFDHVFFNPPFFASGTGTPARDGGRAAARQADGPLDAWIGAGARRLAPRGVLTLIQRTEALPDAIAGCRASGLGSMVVLPVASRAGAESRRFILQARKGGRAPFRILSPLVMHAGTRHTDGPGGHTAETEAILRGAAATTLGERAR